MKRSFILLAFLFAFFTGVSSQDDFRVMFYNVENLFDIYDNPEKNDEDFLPEGFMRWTSWKYWNKLRNITKVITAVGEMNSPVLIGLCEVENDSVLFDLTKRSPLRAQTYDYIISDSPDERGINVALLYQRHRFKLIDKKEYCITVNKNNKKPTRNILHAVGILINTDTLDVLICHFPSRSEGQRTTELARIEAAGVLKHRTDSIFNLRSNANIIIMGDFNDYPKDKSLSKILNAKGKVDNTKLINLFYNNGAEIEYGTYKYQGNWGILDQFIVSSNLINNGNTVKVKNKKANIYYQDFLLEDDKTYYGKKPYRTSLGPRYNGGFSDHLPIFMDLILRD